MTAQNQDMTEDRVSFEWDNNRHVSELQVLSRVPNGWTVVQDWNRSPYADTDKFLEVFQSDDAFEVDTDDGFETPDTVRAVSLIHADWRMRFRVRDVYAGLYDNVERLRAFVRTMPLADDPREAIAAVDDALSMILCHDRGERDRLAPEGHCRHGVYVGGCGPDWMCGACEDGSQ